ncbi:MAG: glycosyltransferase family 2 protein [Crocinitomicaceae bacterium]|nr:glycosyltransferase family 2 protein [Crocinitomicaceae bacterium]
MTDLAVVILNYNSFQDTINLVNELQKQSIVNDLFVLIVDNFSPNNSYEQLIPLESTYKNVKVLQTVSNLGYAKGNNIGLDYLDKNVHPEYVAILNNDVVLENDCFERLIEKYKQLEQAAIIAPKQLDVNNKEVPVYSMNNFLDDCVNLFYFFKLFHRRKIRAFQDTTGKNAMEVDLVPGSFMFSSFERFKALGFFYTNTFLFVEERFITVAAHTKSWKNYIVLDQTYIHAHSKTINSFHSSVGKYKLLYTSVLEFTRVCRKNGKIKAEVLKPLMWLSLLEMNLVFQVKNKLKK